MRTLEITASYSGKVTIPGDKYANESPFFSLKEIVELGDEIGVEYEDDMMIQRQFDLSLMCYEMYEAWKIEILRPLFTAENLPDPECTAKPMEDIRQKGIVILDELSKWFKETEQVDALKKCYTKMFKVESLPSSWQRLTFGGVRSFGRSLNLLKINLEKEEKENEKRNI